MEKIKAKHADNLPNLNRIAGQIEGVKKMIEDERYCIDIIQQLKAIRSAVKTVERNIVRKHLQHCVNEAFHSERERLQKIDELIALFDKSDC